jgi:hypothetical protein
MIVARVPQMASNSDRKPVYRLHLLRKRAVTDFLDSLENQFMEYDMGHFSHGSVEFSLRF